MKGLVTQNFLRIYVIKERKNIKARAHVIIEGRVQGIFFRVQTKRIADYHDVTGWIRNLPDGRVEAVFEGERQNVEKLIGFVRRGPSGARVSNFILSWEPYLGTFDNFKIRYT